MHFLGNQMIKSFFTISFLCLLSIQCSTAKEITISRSSDPEAEIQPESLPETEDKLDRPGTLESRVIFKFEEAKNNLGPNGLMPEKLDNLSPLYDWYCPEMMEEHWENVETGYVSQGLAEEIWDAGFCIYITDIKNVSKKFVSVLPRYKS